MGIDISKKIIVGVTFSQGELGQIKNFPKEGNPENMAEAIDFYLSNSKNNQSGIKLVHSNPYGTEKNLPEYILGIVKEKLPGDGEREISGDKSSIEIIDEVIPEEEKQAITTVMNHFELDLELHPIKKYKVVYFW
jgi:hypothetical protein